MTTALNHVGLRVDDLEEAVRFYEEGLGLERLPSPTFDAPVAWLRVGGLQLHLYEHRVERGRSGHFAVHVDDFAAVHRWADARGCLVRDEAGRSTFVLPGGEAQMYLRDPSGNVVEVDHPDAARWQGEVPGMVRLSDLYPQGAGAARATLYLSQP